MREAQRSRCRTAPWRRTSLCRSVETLWLAAAASACFLHGSLYDRMLDLSFSPCQITDCSPKTRTSRWWVTTEQSRPYSDSFIRVVALCLVIMRQSFCCERHWRLLRSDHVNTVFQSLEQSCWRYYEDTKVCLIWGSDQRAWSYHRSCDACAPLFLFPQYIIRSWSFSWNSSPTNENPVFMLSMPLKWTGTTLREMLILGQVLYECKCLPRKQVCSSTEHICRCFFSSLPLF